MNFNAILWVFLLFVISCKKPEENNTQDKPITTETTQITTTATKRQTFSLQRHHKSPFFYVYTQ